MVIIFPKFGLVNVMMVSNYNNIGNGNKNECVVFVKIGIINHLLAV